MNSTNGDVKYQPNGDSTPNGGGGGGGGGKVQGSSGQTSGPNSPQPSQSMRPVIHLREDSAEQLEKLFQILQVRK